MPGPLARVTALAVTLLLVAAVPTAASDETVPAPAAPLEAAVEVRDSRPDSAAAPGPDLRVRAGGDGSLDVETWLRFTVDGDTPAAGRLVLRAVEPVRAEVVVALADDGWTGSTLTWNQRPLAGEALATIPAGTPAGDVAVELGTLEPGSTTLVLRGVRAQTVRFASARTATAPRLELLRAPVPQPEPEPEPEPEPQPEPDPVAPSWRTYAADSPWNTPVPGDAVVHPDSDALVARIGGPFTSDATQYTVPIFEAPPGTPPVKVRIAWNAFSWVEDDATVREPRPREVHIPIPPDAVPSPGGDGELVVLDLATGEEWGLYQASRQADGTWTASNGYRYHTSWSGAPPARFFSRGAGVPYAAGLLRPEEVVAGRVDHALAFGYPTPSPTFVWPATKSDGRGVTGVDLPEGARLRLDPSLTEAQLRSFGLDDHGVTVARAMQTYGMYLVDISGRPKVFVEAEESADWAGLLGVRSLSGIPLGSFDVVLPPACAGDVAACWATAEW